MPSPTKWFSWQRLWAVIIKEFIQMKRDRATLGMIIGIPLLQVILFGFAINNDPKHLPTAVVLADNSSFVRTLMQGMENSGYFDITARLTSEKAADDLLATGKVLFVLNIPPDFTQKLVRNQNPSLLLEVDATDPVSGGNAIATFNTLLQTVFQYDFTGQLQYLQNTPLAVNPLIHSKYNPARITQYNIVTGLIGTVLTMTMTMITAIAITRERDRGTMESLLATPLHPLEVMVGKIFPYIIVGYIQVSLILIFAHFIFSVPILGNMLLLYLLTFPFIAANLAVGMTISTMAKNPLQAVQVAVFFFLPSILLSGFMFPYLGMPTWAQWLAEILPLTHYLLIVRGILVKGNHFYQVALQVLPILGFLAAIIMLGLTRFRRTLD